MNTRQLEKIFSTGKITKNQFHGVFASDELPKTVQDYPSAYVANVDPSDQPGSHWIAFYFDKNKEGEFWDSYGQHPENYVKTFINFLQINSTNWSMNHKMLQSLDSSVCGEFCVFYLVHRCRGISLNTVVNHFSNKKRLNDSIVYEFVNRHYPFVLAPHNKKTVKHQISRPRRK